MVDNSGLVRLLAEREIERALTLYCRGIDRRDAELVRAVYHDDAIDDHGGAFIGGADDYVAWVIPHLLNFQSTMHTLHNILIDLDLDAPVPSARVESYCIAHHVRAGQDEELIMDVFACRYLDLFEKRPGTQWLIAHRVVVKEWRLRQPMLTEAEQPQGFASSRRDRGDLSYAERLPFPGKESR